MNRTSPSVVNPADPTPLYLQIAEHIRERIRQGTLADGDALAPLREAADLWGVNLHTVRHAYAALAREGIVETTRGPRGTRVTTPAPDKGALVCHFLEVMRAQLGMSPDAVIDAIRTYSSAKTPARPSVWVIECSRLQCESHAREIMAHFDVEAKALPLQEIDELPEGDLVATYFHYNDIRRMWPQRLRDVNFVSINPEPKIASRIGADVRRVRVVEMDAETAEAIAADLSVLLDDGVTVTPEAYANPEAALNVNDAAPVLFPPRAWQELSEKGQVDARAIPLNYVIESIELIKVARRLDWRAAPRTQMEI